MDFISQLIKHYVYGSCVTKVCSVLINAVNGFADNTKNICLKTVTFPKLQIRLGLKIFCACARVSLTRGILLFHRILYPNMRADLFPQT
jgi:hypothetical protein